MKQIFTVCLCLLIMRGVTSAQEDWMPDPNLRQAVREALQLPADAPLTKEKMQELTHLEKQNNGIRNIQGLEFAQNLTNLNLGSNQIRDIRPLRNLVKLRGKPQEIHLPEQGTGVSSGIKDTYHTIPDLDGEIYLKMVASPADVNGDGTINVLDLVVVANAIGKKAPDVNGDGVVNVLDLVIVANAFK